MTLLPGRSMGVRAGKISDDILARGISDNTFTREICEEMGEGNPCILATEWVSSSYSQQQG